MNTTSSFDALFGLPVQQPHPIVNLVKPGAFIGDGAKLVLGNNPVIGSSASLKCHEIELALCAVVMSHHNVSINGVTTANLELTADEKATVTKFIALGTRLKALGVQATPTLLTNIGRTIIQKAAERGHAIT